jgi:hypothetical protein
VQKPGDYGHKVPKGKMEWRNYGRKDMIQLRIDYWNKLDPDTVVSSAHASQRNLKLPFSMRNIICRDEKLYGYLTRERMIGADGHAKNYS